MNFFTKTRILVGTIILLAVINLAILSTIGFHIIRSKGFVPPQPPMEERHTRFVAKELNFNDEQQEKFNLLREQFFVEINVVKMEIRNTYKESMIELSQENPNKQVLDSLSQKIGTLHRNHHEITLKHFSDVKGFCTSEQQECLKRMFVRMMPMEDPPHRRPKGMHSKRNERFNDENN